jgi:tetratricopeptide (TPR) repeat protein
MGSSKKDQSHSTEPQKEESSGSGSFFKRYELLTKDEQASTGEPIFKKYAPTRIDYSETGIQPTGEVFDLTVSNFARPVSKRSKRRAPIKVFWGLALAVLILSVWMIVSIVLSGQGRGSQRSATNQPSALGTESGGVIDSGRSNGSPLTESLVSSLEGSSNEKQRDAAKPVQFHLPTSSSDLRHNVMLARAREFEDRGMLSRAEEEYRAVVASFPDDTFSQVGLSRVQGVLSARRENEELRASREDGLRSFRIGDYARAERELSAAVNAGRADTASLYALGMSYVKLGNHAKARITLDRCLAVSPNYAPAMVGLAETSVATGNRDQALSLLQRALELGGGAEFTPARIRDVISSLDPARAVSRPAPLPTPSTVRSQPAFFGRAVHAHDLILSSCKGYLEVINSVVHFNASDPSHSFHILVSDVSDARMRGDSLRFRIGGRLHRFTLQDRPAKDFLDALVR